MLSPQGNVHSSLKINLESTAVIGASNRFPAQITVD